MTADPVGRYRFEIIRAFWTAIAVSIFAAGCTFEAPKGAPVDLALGSPCTDDRDCTSRICTGAIGAPGECVECRLGSVCPSGRACDGASGRCLPVQEEQVLRHVPAIGGERRTNSEGRVHVGRVSVVPMTTVVESPR